MDDQEVMAQQLEAFDRAKDITPEAAAKASSSKAPLPPKGFSDAVTVLRMCALLMFRLFGVHCTCWSQLHQFVHNLQRPQNSLIGKEYILKFLIPTTFWTVIREAKLFLGQSAALADVDVASPHGLPNPNGATSLFSFHANELLSLKRVELLDMPMCLTAPFKDRDNGKRKPDDKPTAGTPGGHRDPKQPKTGDTLTWIFNNDRHAVFANDPNLQILLQKRPNLGMNEITKACGAQWKRFGDVPKEGLPQPFCGSWCMRGKCVEHCGLCKDGETAHKSATELPTEACEALLQHLRTGINHFASKPAPNQPRCSN